MFEFGIGLAIFGLVFFLFMMYNMDKETKKFQKRKEEARQKEKAEILKHRGK